MSSKITKEDFIPPHQVKKLKSLLRKESEKAKDTLRKTPVRDWMLIHLALDAGLRASELADIKIGDLLLDENYIIVRHGKGDKERGLHIGDALRLHLEEYINWKAEHYESTEPEAYLFFSSGGETNHLSRQAIYYRFKKWAREAGLDDHYSIHSCRHTYASMLYKSSDYNLRLVQSQLGHASIDTTQIYADVLSPDAEKAVNGLVQ